MQNHTYEAEVVRWFTADGIEIGVNELKNKLKDHINRKGKLFIGCDSYLNYDKCVFASAICLHGAENQSGGNYFWYRRNIHSEKYQNFSLRMFQEAHNSLGLALWVSETFPEAYIEVHVDVSSNPSEKSYKYSDALSGMIKGAGFNCKIKPNAWAANAVADKHSK